MIWPAKNIKAQMYHMESNNKKQTNTDENVRVVSHNRERKVSTLMHFL